MVDGMISRSPLPDASASTRLMRSMSMRRLGSPAARRSRCVLLWGE